VKRAFVLAAFAALLVPAAATPAPGAAPTWFHMPNRSVYCHLDLGSPAAILNCWRPRTGYVVSMARKSVVHKATTRQFKRYWEDLSPVLRKGKKWTYFGIRYRNVDGKQLACKNLKGHGWTLGPGAAKSFT
jgi:hypothetical protein